MDDVGTYGEGSAWAGRLPQSAADLESGPPTASEDQIADQMQSLPDSGRPAHARRRRPDRGLLERGQAQCGHGRLYGSIQPMRTGVAPISKTSKRASSFRNVAEDYHFADGTRVPELPDDTDGR